MLFLYLLNKNTTNTQINSIISESAANKKNMKNLNENEYVGYFKKYINLNPEKEVVSGLENSMTATVKFFTELPEDKLNYKYEVGKWSPKDILQHIIDSERVFAYRSLVFARFDETVLPGFDENKYAASVDTIDVSINDLLIQYELVRRNTIALFQSFSEKSMKNIGNSNGNLNSVRALGFLIPGHEIHHINVIKERYL